MYFDKLLEANPDDASALAYKGSLTAKKASGAPVLKAVTLVNDAYKYLDRAAVLVSEGKDMPSETVIEVLINRGSVSKSVPNDVFTKAEQGAQDFLRAAEAARTAQAGNDAAAVRAGPADSAVQTAENAARTSGTEDKAIRSAQTENNVLRAQLLYSAAECFEMCGNTVQANIWYREALRLVSEGN